jgi:hypothetical protein
MKDFVEKLANSGTYERGNLVEDGEQWAIRKF